MSLTDVLSDVRKAYEFSKVATVKNISYRLQVLSIEDEKKVNSSIGLISEVENPDDYFKDLRKEILSRAVVEIKGETVPAVIDTPEGKKDKSIFLKEFFSTLPDAIIEKLFDIYVDLREESEVAISKEMRYDWFKTPDQRNKEYEEKAKKDKEEKDKEKDKEDDSEEKELEDIKFKPLRETEPEIPSNNSQV